MSDAGPGEGGQFPKAPGRGLHTVRSFTPADRPEVEHLLREGLLPGHVDYELHNIERIRASLGSPREHFWVAEAQGRIIGCIAVVESSPDVGRIHWLRVAREWQGDFQVSRSLARAAAGHAREVGFLKLALHAPADAEQRLASYYHQLGFEFSRSREKDGLHVLEFYLNLYERPRLRRRPGSREM